MMHDPILTDAMKIEKLLFSLGDLKKAGNDVMALLIHFCCYLIVEIASLRPGRETEIFHFCWPFLKGNMS